MLDGTERASKRCEASRRSSNGLVWFILAFFMNCFFPDTVNCVASYALVSYLPFYVLLIPLHLSC